MKCTSQLFGNENKKINLLSKTVKIRERSPFWITRKRLKLFRVSCNVLLTLMLYCYCSTIPLLLPRLIVVIFLLGSIFLTNKAFIAIKKRIGKTLFIRERLYYVLESLKMYRTINGEVIDTAILCFEISDEDTVFVSAPLFGNKWTKQLKNLEDYLVAGLGFPLLSKKEFPNHVIGSVAKFENQTRPL